LTFSEDHTVLIKACVICLFLKLYTSDDIKKPGYSLFPVMKKLLKAFGYWQKVCKLIRELNKYEDAYFKGYLFPKFLRGETFIKIYSSRLTEAQSAQLEANGFLPQMLPTP